MERASLLLADYSTYKVVGSVVRSRACFERILVDERMLSLSNRRAHIECVNLPKNVIALTSLAVAVADDDAFDDDGILRTLGRAYFGVLRCVGRNKSN